MSLSTPAQPFIEISIADQLLQLVTSERSYCWPIATALAGAGEANNSGKTPRGWHRIVAMIGAQQPLNTVFVGRRATGEIYTPALAQQHPKRDWILTRILWLQGLEVGRNRGGQVDSMRRYIYIHGTPDTEPLQIPNSHGCIRMRNNDVLALFERVQPNTQVLIHEHSFNEGSCLR